MYDVSIKPVGPEAGSSLPLGPLLHQIVHETQEALGPAIACVVLDSRTTTWVRGTERQWRRVVGGTLLAASHAILGCGRMTVFATTDPQRGVTVSISAVGVGNEMQPAPRRQLDGCPATAYEEAGLVVTQWLYEPNRFSIVLSGLHAAP